MRSRVKMFASGLLFLCYLLVFFDLQITGAADCERAKTTRDIVNCEKAHFNDAVQSLGNLRNQINGVLNDRERKALDAAQSAWLTYREKHCAAAALLYEGGTMESVMMTSCMAGLTEQRVRDLHAIFDPWLRSRKK